MLDTVRRYLSGWTNAQGYQAVATPLIAVADRMSTQLLNSASLAINGAGNAAVKAGVAFYAICQGVLVTKAINTVMPALAGTVVNGTFNVFCFFIDRGGNLSTLMGSAGSTLGGVTFPQFPAGQSLIGFVIVNPTGTGNFVGGTTALDDATVVPNAVYLNTPDAIDATCLVG